MSQPDAPEDEKKSSVHDASESAFEYLMARITLQPSSLLLNQSDDINEIQLHPLDILGYDVGYRYADKIFASHNLTSMKALDFMKLICKDFWEEVFKKKVDRVSTNHQGVFVLSDYCFKWLDRYASDDSMSRQAALNMLYFPCGIIRGAFANLGISSIVSANLGSHPVPGLTAVYLHSERTMAVLFTSTTRRWILQRLVTLSSCS